MRVLLIGGTGFIGAHIVRQLVGCDHQVTVFHRGRTRAALPDPVREIIDSHSTMPIRKFPVELFDPGPDVVIHTTAMGAEDAQATVSAFSGRKGRLVLPRKTRKTGRVRATAAESSFAVWWRRTAPFALLSSGDVYRAYRRFTKIEPGQVDEGSLSEDAPLRTILFPYRAQAASQDALEYWYEKILAERAVLSNPGLPGTILRLPKVHRPGRK
jgi:nucleoside-diphosphate-sugar epimerase